MNWPEAKKQLQEPFSEEEISWVPVQELKDKNRALIAPYIARWRIEERLDRVVGVENWRAEYEHVQLGAGDFKVRCRLTVLGVTKENVGEWSTLSGAYTKAFRRVAENFGIGRHVRAIEPVWVGKSNGKYRLPKKIGGRVVAEPTEEDLAASEHAVTSRKPPAVRPPGARNDDGGFGKAPVQQGAKRPAAKDPIELINKLVERLGNEGKGVEAAKIIAQNGGYGKTPEQQRALYGKLRRLLTENEAA